LAVLSDKTSRAAYDQFLKAKHADKARNEQLDDFLKFLDQREELLKKRKKGIFGAKKNVIAKNHFGCCIN
jgi:DnaJ-class molecular chaperone